MFYVQLKCIPGEQLAYIASTTAIAISKQFDNDDLNILSSFFNAIGDSIGIIAARNAACESGKKEK
jgi:pyrroline-5-carboxylate reductase